MKVCDSIEKVKGGYLITGLRFPYGDMQDNGRVICQKWDEVVALLRKAAAAEDDEVTDER